MLWLVLSCAIDSSQFERRSGDPELVAPTVSAPPAPRAEDGPLYQALYADEVGDEARPLGQRARMMAWMTTLGLTPTQLGDVRETHAALMALEEQHRADRVAHGQRELETLGPVYEAIVVGLAEGRDVSDQATPLTDAQAQLPSLREQEIARTREALDVAAAWVARLEPHQQRLVQDSRYFLRRRLGPMVNPGDYEALVGTRWMAGDFDTRSTAPPSDDGMDLGGLWTAEAWRAHPDDLLGPLQQQAIALMALSEPGIAEAAEVMLGLRQPLDFGSTPDDPREASSPPER